ncbi:MAG TPA: hypothetical protein VNG13_07400 [Mycobacteriales bacterium]|nr:hypothetical protein [Mycobacteriales bacterium]
MADCYAGLKAGDAALLDCAWGFSDRDQHGDVDVDVTVAASDEATAYELASASVRAAIQHAGGFTPDWDERVPDLSSVAYRLTDERVELVPA